MEWNSLSLYDIKSNNNTYWTLEHTFSSDLLAGLLAAGCLYISYIEEDNQSKQDLRFKIHSPEKSGIKLLSDFDNSYISYKSYDEYNTADIYPIQGKYGIWIVSPTDLDDLRYDFVTFTNPQDFMRGFISMSNAFQVDFTEYILGPLYDFDGLEYDIDGYTNYTEEYNEEYQPDYNNEFSQNNYIQQTDNYNYDDNYDEYDDYDNGDYDDDDDGIYIINTSTNKIDTTKSLNNTNNSSSNINKSTKSANKKNKKNKKSKKNKKDNKKDNKR